MRLFLHTFRCVDLDCVPELMFLSVSSTCGADFVAVSCTCVNVFRI
jgi:hypothetical protein